MLIFCSKIMRGYVNLRLYFNKLRHVAKVWKSDSLAQQAISKVDNGYLHRPSEYSEVNEVAEILQ